MYNVYKCLNQGQAIPLLNGQVHFEWAFAQRTIVQNDQIYLIENISSVIKIFYK